MVITATFAPGFDLVDALGHIDPFAVAYDMAHDEDYDDACYVQPSDWSERSVEMLISGDLGPLWSVVVG